MFLSNLFLLSSLQNYKMFSNYLNGININLLLYHLNNNKTHCTTQAPFTVNNGV